MKALTVRQLIDLLSSQDEDAEVHFAYNYGDHWRTEVAPPVYDVGEGFVVHSEYHRMDKTIDEDEEEEAMDVNCYPPGKAPRRVVVLR